MRREKGEGRREKGEGRRDKRNGRREKGKGKKVMLFVGWVYIGVMRGCMVPCPGV